MSASFRTARACAHAVLWCAAAVLAAGCHDVINSGGAAAFSVGGNVAGLVPGASVELADGNGDSLTVAANGVFQFGVALPVGATYDVTVFEQPAGGRCIVSGSAGTVMGDAVANVSVLCTPDVYGVGGSVAGLLPGRTLVLEDNGGNDTPVTGDGAFSFSAGVSSGSNYAVTVRTQPEGQSCSITGGSGTIAAGDVLDVAVDCSDDTYNIGVTVSGVNAGGLVLENDGGDPLSIARNGSFNFDTPVDSGAMYAISVSSQPAGEVCTVAGGTGTVTDANVSGVTVACVPNLYSVAGTLSGLYAGRSLVVQDDGGNTTTLAANGAFSFSAQVPSGSDYAVTVLTQPVGQSCAVTDGSGPVAGANVTGVAIACSDNTYNVGVTVSGLIDAGLILQDNGGDNLAVSANGLFNFATALSTGAAYSVTVLMQPANQTCTVTDGSGTIVGSNVTDVLVTCTGEWTWMGGSSASGTGGMYGAKGTGSTANTPGGRYEAASFTDTSGNFWLFGGYGIDSTGTNDGDLNDLWRYDPGTGVWTWVGGANTVGASGLYGVEGTPSAANAPGARAQPSGKADAAGNFWLFGGFGYDKVGTRGPLNDLWKFDPGNGTWTWVSGANTADAYGLYSGMPGVASTAYAPGARTGAVSWIDSGGNLWLFGGQGNAATTGGYLNDLWEFQPGAGTWTWISGSSGRNAAGSYGMQGTAAAGDTPGARTGANGWVDSLGNLWLFGGTGYDGSGTPGLLNDLWEFNPTAGTWTWVSGAATANGNSSYGTLGIPAASNEPGGRDIAAAWVDPSGNFWLFGGYGLDQSNLVAGAGSLADLWEFSTATGLWTWIDGSASAGASGTYPAAPGTAGFSYAPGGRQAAAPWVDSGGNLWVLGGSGIDAGGDTGYLNDLWRYTP